MSRVVASRLVPPDGFASAQAALMIAALADVHEKLRQATRGLTPAELAWQPGTAPPPAAPGPSTGLNTIGMLMAHVAVAETHLAQVGLLGERDGHVQDVIGITVEEEGLPLAPGAAPARALGGRELEWFDAMLERSFEHAKRAASALTDEDLAADVVRPPREDGTQRVFDRRWVLYHAIEHAAGHLGQIQLVRHLLALAKQA